MKHWDLTTITADGRADPAIVSSTDEGRAIVLHLREGERLAEHQVHERAWLVVVSGDAEISAPEGEAVTAGPGHMFEFEPGERHELVARTEAKVLLMLIPWPGDGHPGAMSLEQKAGVRARAAEHSAG